MLYHALAAAVMNWRMHQPLDRAEQETTNMNVAVAAKNMREMSGENWRVCEGQIDASRASHVGLTVCGVRTVCPSSPAGQLAERRVLPRSELPGGALDFREGVDRVGKHERSKVEKTERVGRA